jgi:hypothetical protein
MANFVFDPPLRLARDVTVRTLDDAAEFARTYVGPRLPRRRDRLVRVIEEVSGEASGRAAAHMFRAWALAEGLLAEESSGPPSAGTRSRNYLSMLAPLSNQFHET